MKKRSIKSFKSLAIFAALAGSYALHGQAAKAELPVFEPDLVSTTWQEDQEVKTSVSINGKDLATFKSDGSGSADQRAEQFAGKLRQVLSDEKFDANKLLPGKDGECATAKIDGVTVLKFDKVEQDTDKAKNALEQSYKAVNSIRSALGATTLPQTYLKIAELAGRDNGKTNGGSCFSGHASWYGGKFHGRKTSDGSRYNQDGLTAAHRSLPFGTKLLVMNRRNGQSCVVQVNDRGPFVGDRVIDLSRGAARQLNMLGSGVAVVDCLVLGTAQ